MKRCKLTSHQQKEDCDTGGEAKREEGTYVVLQPILFQANEI
jgi:hypothetical protein